MQQASELHATLPQEHSENKSRENNSPADGIRILRARSISRELPAHSNLRHATLTASLF